MTDSTQTERALEQDSYQLIKRRLSNFGSELKTHVDSINNQRIEVFGSTELKVKGRARVRTEHNCVARDIVLIGDKLIFAYNVLLGLKQNTKVSDVFSVQKLHLVDDHYEIEPYPSETKFLTNQRFLRDFEELYTYYKETRFQHLFVQNNKLFALFQIGEKISDVRVFQWQIAADETLEYIDNRGERELKATANFDFEWQKTDRKDHIAGRHPHVNIADKVFVEISAGKLTVKIENNTESGEGIYQETVEDSAQSLSDSSMYYAEVGELILLKVLPYREKQWRYFIYNHRTQQVIRQDALGNACIQLPDDHGIIFPGGYYLQSGQTRYFDDQLDNLLFHRQLKSPNGEDVLYIFYEQNEGKYALFAYNMIEKNLQNPIYCHGYGIYDDGIALTFKAEQEPERVHPIQIWQSPFYSSEFAAKAPRATGLLGTIGNPDLVRAIADLYSVCKAINEQSPTIAHYEALIALTRSILDRYHWLSESAFADTTDNLHSIFETSEQVLDEFEKVNQIESEARCSEQQIAAQLEQVFREVRPDSFKQAKQFVTSLAALRDLKGKVISLEDVKYINVDMLRELQQRIDQQTLSLSQATAHFLQQPQAFATYTELLQSLEAQCENTDSVTELNGLLAELDTLGDELDLLNHTMLDLEIDDSRVRTQILEDVSGIYAQVNRAKAAVEIQKRSLGSVEAKAEFSARFKLFSQSITSGLSAAKTPEQCDEQLSRLLIQLEELESQFSEYDEFLNEILAKRDDVYESFEAHKQQLVDERQRKALNLANAAERILQGVVRRTQSFKSQDEINSYFASDPMISKLRKLSSELKALGDEVKADDIQAKLKAAKDQGIRTLRDKLDIYSDGGNTIKIGKHGFSVNKQILDLTLLPRNNQLMLHLSGTEYFDQIPNPQVNQQLSEAKQYWEQNLVSENAHIYRGEFLAAQVLRATSSAEQPFTEADLQQAAQQGELLKVVQKFAEPRYQEGYEKGIHDHDASLILSNLLSQKSQLGLLIYPASCRVAAQLFYLNLPAQHAEQLKHQAKQAQMIAMQLDDHALNTRLSQQVSEQLAGYLEQAFTDYLPQLTQFNANLAAQYLIRVLAQTKQPDTFELAAPAKNLAEQFTAMAKAKGFWQELIDSLDKLATPVAQCNLLHSWLNAYGAQQQCTNEVIVEASNYLLLSHTERCKFTGQEISVETNISGLMGQHARIVEQTLDLEFADFFSRTNDYIDQQVAAYNQFQKLKSQVLSEQKSRLQLNEYKPRPLSSFVRNQLIDKVYFPIIGDNLAKQIGASGNDKRTDLMGMLLLISPPGYGKTTLIEYVANRLGLTFVKVNCPSIGHDQVSLDPAQAINATAAKEIEKINLSFEMGNNVMLYLDDIQHTHPEFLQKFISLCDGSRRIDGVWNGKSKTYDLRGKKFAVVMAGNPYTESGESFKIPDMLANRADIYNLGDTLAGCEQEFAMSFIENTLTSNAVLAPLANRNMTDLYKMVRMAQGEDIPSTELEFNYSQAQLNEIVSVLGKLLEIKDTILKVNAQYIASAAQDDKYRTEPPFKLQGSYRNMNKMAEKVVAAMNDKELENLIRDHYRGEAQTLSKGSEENLLKLGEIRGTLTEQEQTRWAEIKAEYARLNRVNDGSDPVFLAVDQLSELNRALSQIVTRLDKSQLSHDYSDTLNQLAQKLEQKELVQQLTELQQTIASAPYEAPLKQLAAQQHLASEQLKESLSKTVEACGQQLKFNNRSFYKTLKATLQAVSEQLANTPAPEVTINNQQGDQSAQALQLVTELLTQQLNIKNDDAALTEKLEKVLEQLSKDTFSNTSSEQSVKEPFLL
ncbi:DNA repair ATPase [Pseudoalteromonas sp. T1lg65]|uniref:DNA repair ATPase n=1 Tax=Pseudoalteromonas sp. T1lg65 TaxID=2077101 RepID=UPI003F78EF29